MVCATDHYILTALRAEAEQQRHGEGHSGLGIASFGISTGVGFLMVAAFVAAFFLSTDRVRQGQLNNPGQALVGFAIIFLLAVDVLATALGIAALCQPGRKRLFGLLGLVFSSGTIVGTIGLIILGLYLMSLSSENNDNVVQPWRQADGSQSFSSLSTCSSAAAGLSC
jgi:hypothetical protein